MELRQRKKNRLKGYDYGRPGYYFVTICAKDRAQIFWEDVNVGRDDPGAPLSQYGQIVNKYISSIQISYKNICVDKYVIMPNHVHLIIQIDCPENGAPRSSRPTQLVPRVIAALKRFTNQEAGFDMWQTSYHDHIIRNEADYWRIWEYIDTSPAKWREDCYFEEGKR